MDTLISRTSVKMCILTFSSLSFVISLFFFLLFIPYASATKIEDFSGIWKIKSQYKVYDLNEKKHTKFWGWGKVYILFNPQTKSFTGLGWINRGTKKETLEEAEVDTLSSTFICFEIRHGFLHPSGKQWVVRTKTLFRTSRSSVNECNFDRVECELKFPIDVKPRYWKGHGKCEYKGTKVELTLELTKSEE